MTIVKLKIEEKKKCHGWKRSKAERKMRKERAVFRRNDENEKTDKMNKGKTLGRVRKDWKTTGKK